MGGRSSHDSHGARSQLRPTTTDPNHRPGHAQGGRSKSDTPTARVSPKPFSRTIWWHPFCRARDAMRGSASVTTITCERSAVAPNQPTESRKEIGVQARFGRVHGQELGRPWRQQRVDEQQVAKRTVRQLCRAQGAQQPVLVHRDLEPRLGVQNLDARAGKGIFDRRIERLRIDDLADGLQGGGQVPPVVGRHRRVRADAYLTSGGVEHASTRKKGSPRRGEPGRKLP
jgi:hypothetical protein